jgi:DNA-binding NarL/FixJ family response regulator
MRVLIVEDNDEMRRCLANRLAAEGVETVFETSDLAGALGDIRKADAILCDDVFPIIRGNPPFELAWNAVHKAAQSLAKPFVLITTDEDTWFGALRQDIPAFKEQDAAEAVLHVVRSLGAHVLTAPDRSAFTFFGFPKLELNR